MIVVSDTTPLIALVKANRLELLGSLFGKVVIPEAVHDELCAKADLEQEARAVEECGFVTSRKVQNGSLVDALRRIAGLHQGECEAIALADEMRADLLLVDDLLARRTADNMNIRKTGTIGVLKAAYLEGFLSREGLLDCIDAFKASRIYISDALYEQLIFEVDSIEATRNG